MNLTEKVSLVKQDLPAEAERHRKGYTDWDEAQYQKASAQIAQWMTQHIAAQRADLRARAAERLLTADSSLDQFKGWLTLKNEANEAKSVFALSYRNNWLE